MDLVDDLSSEVALALLIEKNFGDKILAADAKSFISRLETVFEHIDNSRPRRTELFNAAPAVRSVSP